MSSVVRVFSAKMKIVKLVCVSCVSMIVLANACTKIEWRGHRLYCCQNGTVIHYPNGQEAWVKQKPLVCNNAGENGPESHAWKVVAFVVLVLGSIYCCCQSVYCCIWGKIMKRYPKEELRGNDQGI